MTMLQMTPGSCPRVEDYKGDVAIWAGEGEDTSGFILEPAGAVTVAVRLLAQVAKLRNDDMPVVEVISVSAEPAVLDDGEDAVKLTFSTAEGAPLSVWLDLTRFAELTAGFARLSRIADGFD